MTFLDLLGYSKVKTRVLIYTSDALITQLMIAVLDFYGKNFDYFLQNGSEVHHNNDFVIFETSDVEKAALFKPTIFFISKEIKSATIDSALKNITPGGILIYPGELETTVEECSHYFRKLPFETSLFQKNKSQYILTTLIGSIPLSSTNENLIENLEGIKLLCQQFGVMEEEFYEPVMNFE